MASTPLQYVSDNPAAHPSWYDPGMPARDDCVIAGLLESRAKAHPDRLLARFEDGTDWTYAEVLARARGIAAGLAAHGVKPGDRVLCWLPNCPEYLLAWFGASLAGAVHVPLNTAYRGALLGHVITNSGARIMIVHAGLADRLAEIDLAALETVFVIGEVPALDLPLKVLPFASLPSTDTPPAPGTQPWDTHAIIYTSGTTGPSKGVLCSYVHAFCLGTISMGYIRAGETILVNLPLFHVSGIAGVYAALVRGGTVAIVDAFSPTRFWSQVRHFNAVTSCGIVGSMGPLLVKQPPSEDDRNHSYRFVVIAPLLEPGLAIAERHGFGFYSSFGMTEVPLPLISDTGDTRLGSCGRPRNGVEARVVDGNDIEVPDGTVGELILRTDLPWAFMHGYHNMPEATAAAWRNGWFHTGDAFRRDPDGTFFFVDRIKDAIRRRGENVSSSEVEAEILAHEAVRDCAVIAVPSEHGEDEIMAVIEAKPEHAIDPLALTAFLTPRLAYFMVPRFIRVVDALPRTHSLRIQKNLLRADGVTADSWDREAAGLFLAREKLR